MSMQDLMSDFVARINNSILAKNNNCEVLKNNLVINVTNKLTKLGYFESFEIRERTVNVVINLNKIKKIKRMSKPGRRVYTSYSDIPKLFGGHGFYVLSTSKGVLTNIEANASKSGGELLFSIF
ncbi:MAG: 30S ribosomal protein S8 [candidate division SR1 bacterium]|nr:30S ribosomal protein S8 [candidate division SR1 bacterium]